MSVWALLVAAGAGSGWARSGPRRSSSSVSCPCSPSRCDAWTSPTGSMRSSSPCRPGWEEPAILLAEAASASKVVAAVHGGATRAESVARGARRGTGGRARRARARRSQAAPDRGRARTGACAALRGVGRRRARPSDRVDTVKTVSGEAVTGTLSREKLVAVQTPQAFVASKLREAYAGDLVGSDPTARRSSKPGRPREVGRGRPAPAEGDDQGRPRTDCRLAVR